MNLYDAVREPFQTALAYTTDPGERCDILNAATATINALTMDELLAAISGALERGVVRGQLVSE